MTSQDGMSQLFRAITNLSQAMHVMVDQQQEYELLAIQHDERIRASGQEIGAIRTRMQENTVRIRELISVAKQMQAEIARLDSAS
ncbi:MAG: hypothetical protein OXL97_02740 [Chloroflexota bacterium]|nr:hypothetical protein [Chloroflexota bacterium]